MVKFQISCILVDCRWGPWKPCSRHCGNGIKTRKIESQAIGNGKQCEGSSKEPCIEKDCEGK